MIRVPQDLKETLNDERLRQTVEQQPGSTRFKAMTMGLAAIHHVNQRESGDKPKS